ncbi:START domain-containing protein [Colwellia psychrerythraea]|uniref:Lipid-binding START domain protein n=1 Tax=Colwellia psychrerythraea TaxID=28229 RepID=A0A099L5Z0_COLPS|nr:START domain-containing protein [Colwellia psychrerythraea]KGJ97552.1 lipid-binding START domain protein [Colwellia psychrerythraea]
MSIKHSSVTHYQMKLLKFTSWFITFFILISVINPCYSSSESTWKLRHSEKSINIYTRKIANSKYLEIKAKVRLNTPFVHLLAKFSDDEKCWTWIKKCLSVKLLKHISDDEKIYYSVLTMPWPLSERDFVFHSVRKVEIQKGLATLELSPLSDIYKATKYVRASSTITYRLTSLSTSSSSLSIIMHTELGGTTPASLINSLLVNDLLNDIKELTRLFKNNL